MAIETASFINASEHFKKGKRQNRLLDEHIEKIVSTYQFRKEEQRCPRRVPMELIEEEDFNLNSSRYINTSIYGRFSCDSDYVKILSLTPDYGIRSG